MVYVNKLSRLTLIHAEVREPLLLVIQWPHIVFRPQISATSRGQTGFIYVFLTSPHGTVWDLPARFSHCCSSWPKLPNPYSGVTGGHRLNNQPQFSSLHSAPLPVQQWMSSTIRQMVWPFPFSLGLDMWLDWANRMLANAIQVAAWNVLMQLCLSSDICHPHEMGSPRDTQTPPLSPRMKPRGTKPAQHNLSQCTELWAKHSLF